MNVNFFFILANLILLSFEEIENESKLKIEDIEEIFFDGVEAGLFKLKIDYTNKLLKISHLKKKSLNQENVLKLKNKVSMLKEKLNLFINKLDLISN